MTRQVITNLSKGEIGPELYGRIDVPQYAAGAKRAINFIAQRYGGMAFRPGFRFVAAADDIETWVRYVPFENSLETAYVLAFDQLGFRPLALGGMVKEENQKILSVTKEEQAALNIDFHDVEVGDRIFLDGITGMTELNARFATVIEVIDADNVRIDINTIDYGTFTGSDGTQRVAPPTPPPAPPSPPPAPPAPPDPPDTGGGGGSGGDLGGYDFDSLL